MLDPPDVLSWWEGRELLSYDSTEGKEKRVRSAFVLERGGERSSSHVLPLSLPTLFRHSISRFEKLGHELLGDESINDGEAVEGVLRREKEGRERKEGRCELVRFGPLCFLLPR